jgi:hypothetical protein
MPDPEEVRRQIRSAFPTEPFLGPVTGGCKCLECTELTESLRHRKWDALDNQTMDAQFGSLPLLSPEAFSTFLPAWLMRSLDNKADGADELSRSIRAKSSLYRSKAEPRCVPALTGS